MDKVYMCIDLKSFYASVECRERGLNPITTNLVVADKSRTEKTICLAVTPALKKYGIPGRVRLFEVNQKVKNINYQRKLKNKGDEFKGKSYDANELERNNSLELDYIAAPPRMALYMKYSIKIYNIYMRYISNEDMYPYSVDEVFLDVTKYLRYYKMTAKELATKMIKEVFNQTGITATAGIGTNMYLAKIAMDIWAKHVEPNKDGVRIAELNEYTYRKYLWNHRPLKDFWRIGAGYAKKLEEYGLYTMGDIARCSIGKEKDYYNEDLLYKMFGINAELLIDHAWGWEPCTMQQIKSYKPKTNSLNSGQVLHCPYDAQKAKLIVQEMTELLSLDLVEKHLVTDQIVLTIGYDVSNISKEKNVYEGEISIDRYGRKVPKHAHGTINLEHKTSSTRQILEAVEKLYDRITNKKLLIRRIYISANNLINEKEIQNEKKYEQINLFTNYEEIEKNQEKEKKENKLQHVLIDIKKKYGKNAILKGMNFEEGGTTIERNEQIGGHKE